jgi:hypothetical protein
MLIALGVCFSRLSESDKDTEKRIECMGFGLGEVTIDWTVVSYYWKHLIANDTILNLGH